jgi:hypothetical protein
MSYMAFSATQKTLMIESRHCVIKKGNTEASAQKLSHNMSKTV